MNTAPLTEIDFEQVKADFGDYYLSQGQNLDSLHMLPFESEGTMDAFTIIPTNDTIVRRSNVRFQSILQQYQEEFTPKGKVTFKPVKFELFQMKIDEEFVLTPLQDSWLSFLSNNNLDRQTYPFVKWVIENYLFAQSKEDFEMEAIYNGIAVDAQDGVPGNPSEVMDGIRKVVTDFIAQGLDPIVTGNSDADPAVFVTQVETFVKSWPEKYRRLSMPINMSRTNQEKFIEGMQKKYNMQYAQVGALTTVRNFENISVAGRASMMGSEGMWATPKYNALMAVKGFENRNAFQIESAKRKVAMFSDWWAGLYFVQPELLFVNDKVGR